MKHTAKRTPRFDREWKEMIALLPESRQPIVENAIRQYQLTGDEPSGLKGAEMMAFLLIKKIVDRRYKQREARRRKQQSDTSTERNQKQAVDMSEIKPHKESTQPCVQPSRPAKSAKPTRMEIIKKMNRISRKGTGHRRRS